MATPSCRRRHSAVMDYSFITKLQCLFSYSLWVTGIIHILLEIIAYSRYDEAVQWLFAAVSFGIAAILCGLTAYTSFWMTTNATYRLFQLLSLSIAFTSLPGAVYSTLLLVQVIRDTDSKLTASSSWTKEETADEVALQAVRWVSVFTYALQVALLTGQAFLGCCVVARFPYLWSTPTWKRDSMTSAWHINGRLQAVGAHSPLL